METLLGILFAIVLMCPFLMIAFGIDYELNKHKPNPEEREILALRYRLKIAENNAEHWKEMFEAASKELVKLKTSKK